MSLEFNLENVVQPGEFTMGLQSWKDLVDLGRQNLRVLIERQKNSVVYFARLLKNTRENQDGEIRKVFQLHLPDKENKGNKPAKAHLNSVMSSEKTKETIDAYEDELHTIRSYALDLTKTISKMCELLSETEDKPYLPNLRPIDHFCTGDRIFVYVPEPEEISSRAGFKEATVVDGYKGNEGFLYFSLDNSIEGELDGPPDCIKNALEESPVQNDVEGYPPRFTYKRGDVMLKSDFEYLGAHPDFIDKWVSCSNEIHHLEYGTRLERALHSLGS